MKVIATIEETISQKIIIEVSSIENAYDEIREMYKNGKIKVEDPSLIAANVMIVDETGEQSDWMDLHV